MNEEKTIFFTTNDNTITYNENFYFENDEESIIKKIRCEDFNDENEWKEFYLLKDDKNFSHEFYDIYDIDNWKKKDKND